MIDLIEIGVWQKQGEVDCSSYSLEMLIRKLQSENMLYFKISMKDWSMAISKRATPMRLRSQEREFFYPSCIASSVDRCSSAESKLLPSLLRTKNFKLTSMLIGFNFGGIPAIMNYKNFCANKKSTIEMMNHGFPM